MADPVAANIPTADQNKAIREAAMAPTYMRISDISGANSDFVAAPSGGRVKAIRGSVSGDPGADTLITLSNETKSLTIGTITVANSSSAGDTVSNVDISPSAGRLDDGDVIKALSNAAATLGVSLNLTVEIDRASR